MCRVGGVVTVGVTGVRVWRYDPGMTAGERPRPLVGPRGRTDTLRVVRYTDGRRTVQYCIVESCGMSSECRSRRGTYLLQDSDDIPGVCRVQYCTELD